MGMDYNEVGKYYHETDVLIQYACLKRDVNLISSFHFRGADLHLMNQNYPITLGCIELIIWGKYDSVGDDFHDCLLYLLSRETF